MEFSTEINVNNNNKRYRDGDTEEMVDSKRICLNAKFESINDENETASISTKLQSYIVNSNRDKLVKLLKNLGSEIFEINYVSHDEKEMISAFVFAFRHYLKNNVTKQSTVCEYQDTDKIETSDKLMTARFETVINVDSNNPCKLLLTKLDYELRKIMAKKNYQNLNSESGAKYQKIVNDYLNMMSEAINENNYNALYMLLSTGRICKILLKNFNFTKPVFAAIYKGDVIIIKMMIKYGIRFNIETRDTHELPVYILSQLGYLTCLKLIVNTFYVDNTTLLFDLNPVGNNVFHYAVFHNQIKIMNYLLSLDGAKNFINKSYNENNTLETSTMPTTSRCSLYTDDNTHEELMSINKLF